MKFRFSIRLTFSPFDTFCVKWGKMVFQNILLFVIFSVSRVSKYDFLSSKFYLPRKYCTTLASSWFLYVGLLQGYFSFLVEYAYEKDSKGCLGDYQNHSYRIMFYNIRSEFLIIKCFILTIINYLVFVFKSTFLIWLLLINENQINQSSRQCYTEKNGFICKY